MLPGGEVSCGSESQLPDNCDVGRLFMYLLATCVSSLEKCLLGSFACFPVRLRVGEKATLVHGWWNVDRCSCKEVLRVTTDLPCGPTLGAEPQEVTSGP